MSILNPIPQAVLHDHFVYRGYFAGIVPIYVGSLKDEEPMLAEQDGIPEVVLTIAIVLVGIAMTIAAACGWEPKDPRGFNPVRIASRIDGKPLAQDPDYAKFR